ncbi:MAG: hypothetical protein AAF591_19660 [Verrucomicrobiota bacterium]
MITLRRFSSSTALLAAALPIILTFSAPAGELNDIEHGFSIVLPPEFNPHTIPANSETVIHCFIIGEPSPDELGTVLTIERLPWTFPPGQRMNPEDIDHPDNVELTIEDIQWQDIILDLARHDVSNPSGVSFVNYSVQIPVSPNAVQLNVGSSIENADLAKTHLQNILQSFKTSSLTEADPQITVTTNKRSNLASLLGAVGVAALVGLAIIFFLSKGKSDDQGDAD